MAAYNRLLLALLLLASPAMADVDIADRGQLGTATSDDALLGVDASAAAGSRLKRILFTGDPEDLLSGNGTWITVLVGQADCSTITAGFCIDDDDGILYYHNGTTVAPVDTDTDTAVTLGTANGLSLDGQALSLAAATTSTPGAMTAAQATALAAIDTEAELEALLDLADLQGTIGGAKIAPNAIDSDHYVDGSIDVEHLSASAVRATTASKSAAYTIGTDNAKEAYGGTIYVTGAATITAPAVATGMSFTVITIGAVAVSLDVNASDRMYLDGVALDDGDKATNTSTTGDMITCAYESAAGWYCASGSPDGDHWTDGGA
ncbi:MAG: hypothetical protein RBS34_14285 [Desulfofustis sp.]|jgi:hypothetical protein|nr:hypothetical protein [Desulfofustis sp.]